MKSESNNALQLPEVGPSEVTTTEGSSELTQEGPCEGTFEKVPHELTLSHEASGTDSALDTYVTGKQLEEEESNAYTKSIGHLSLESLRRRGGGGEKIIRVIIKIPIDEMNTLLVPLHVTPQDSIESVKEKIKIRKNIPADQLRLFFDGKELEGGRTLSEYEIKSGSMISVLPYRKADSNRCILI